MNTEGGVAGSDTAAVTLFAPPRRGRGLQVLHALSALFTVRLLGDSHPRGCGVEAPCGFVCICLWLMMFMMAAHLPVRRGQTYIFGEIPIEILGPF